MDDNSIISSFVDRGAIGGDRDFFLSALNDIYNGVLKADSIKISAINANNISAVGVAATQAKENLVGMANSTQVVTNRIAQLNGSSKEFTEVLRLQTQAEKNVADANLSSTKARIANEAATKKQADAAQKLTVEQKLQQTINATSAGSYNQLNAQLKLLTIQYKNLSDAERGSASGQELQKDILEKNAQLKIFDADMGNYQRNVGNYNSSLGRLSKGIKGLGGLGVILSKALGIDPEITEDIREVGVAIRDIQHARELEEVGLQGEAELYEQSKAKIDAFAASANAAAVSEDTLTASTDANVASTEEATAAETANAVSTTKAKVATTAAAAARTHMATATEAQVVAQEELAAANVVELTTEEQLAALQVTLATQIDARVASELALTASTDAASAAAEAAAISNTELAVTAEAGAVAMTGEALATEAATVATTTFSEVLAATGIGAIILAIGAAIFYVVENVKNWTAATASVKQAIEDETKSFKDLIDATKTYDDINRDFTTRQLSDLDKLIAKRKTLGVNSLEGLALDKQIADARLKATTDEVKLNDITAESVAKKNSDAINAAGTVKAAEELKQQYILKTGKATKETAEAFAILDKLRSGEIEATKENLLKLRVLGDKDYVESIKRFDEQIKKGKEVYDAKKADYESDSEKFKANEDAKEQSALNTNQILKLTDDERRQFILESAKIEAGIITSKNALILSDERSTLDQRLAAIKSNAAQELAVINAVNAAKQSDPTVSKVDKQISGKQAAADRTKLADNTNRAIFDVNEVYRKKDLQADLDFDKTKLQADKEFQEKSISDQFTSLQNNVDALTQAGEDQKQIITDEYEFAKATQILTDKQRLALDAAYQQKLVDNDKDTQDKIKVQEDKATADFVNFLQKKQQIKITSANDEVDIADDTKAIDLISEYEIKIQKATGEKRKKLEKELQDSLKETDAQAAFDKLRITEQALQQELAAAILIEAPTKDIDTRITDNKRKEAEAQVAIEKDKHDRIKALKDQEAEQDRAYANAVIDLEQTLGDATFQKQKDQIQKQEDLNDAKLQRDIDAVNASTRSEQDKAAAITIIQDRAAAEKEALDLRSRKADYEKAKFDKQIAILETLANIAIDISKQDYYAASLAGIALIKLIATPIPAYKLGKHKNDNYAGPAIWGDGGKSELKISEDGSMEVSPTVPTLTHVKASDIILPDFMGLQMLNHGVFNSTRRADENLRGFDQHSNSREISELKAEIKSMKNALINTIRNKPTARIDARKEAMRLYIDQANWQTEYMNQNVNF